MDEWKEYVLAPQFEPDEKYFEIGEAYLIDAVLMLGAIESLLKALFLEKGIVVHELASRKEKDKQRARPIPLLKLFPDARITANEVRSKIKFSRTIDVSTCLSEVYLNEIAIPKSMIELGRWLKSVRNQVHFLYGNNQCFSPATLCTQIDGLLCYFRKTAFPKMNAMGRRYSLNQIFQKSDFNFRTV